MRDPAARIEAQDRDGVRAEVMYASYGMSLFHIEDSGLRDACFRAFNDWAAEYCSHDPKRLIGVGLIALDEVDAAFMELERIAKKGLQGAMIWAEPPEDLPYSHADFEPFWQTAEALGMKLSLHSLTSRRKNFSADTSGLVYRSVVLYQEVVRTITDLILNGVLERHPELKFVSAENEIAWLPFHLWRMDQLYEKLKPMSPIELSMEPSEYFQRQVFATFIEDPFFSATVPAIGSTNIMWSSDFPHLASSFPHSRELIEKNLANVAEADLTNIVHDNVARLYAI
jgi:predicted TIM-barrel fold metal-dependent hydrolase